jgi:hypothetical protein
MYCGAAWGAPQTTFHIWSSAFGSAFFLFRLAAFFTFFAEVLLLLLLLLALLLLLGFFLFLCIAAEGASTIRRLGKYIWQVACHACND